MVQDLITGAAMRRRRQAKQKQYRYETRISETIAIGLYKEQCIRLIVEQDKERKNELFIRLKEEMMKPIVPVRPSPSSPRRWYYCNKYQCNLKPSF